MNSRAEYSTRMEFFGKSTAQELAAIFGTPLYIYNERILRKRCREMKDISKRNGFLVNYSVKANSNPALLRIIREEGLVADAMSPGELRMDYLAGFEPQEIFYISNNNSAAEILDVAPKCRLVSVDSLSQLEQIGQLIGGKVMARINPGIGDGHSAKVVTGGTKTKFGISPDRLPELYDILSKYDLKLAGLNQHIGSLFMRPDSYLKAAEALLEIAAKLPPEIFKDLEIIDFGGGFGIPYHKYENEDRLDLTQLANGLNALMEDWSKKSAYQGFFLVEPGRYVVAECGLLLGLVTSTKTNAHVHYVGTDLGFNVLQRPMLYDAFHDIEVYAPKRGSDLLRQTIVGNICESGDILAKDRQLPPLKPGDLIGVLDAGAYGFSMASNYNERLLPAEVLIKEDGEYALIRRRQTLEDLESCLVNHG